MRVSPHPISHKLINNSLFWQDFALSAFIRWYQKSIRCDRFFLFSWRCRTSSSLKRLVHEIDTLLSESVKQLPIVSPFISSSHFLPLLRLFLQLTSPLSSFSWHIRHCCRFRWFKSNQSPLLPKRLVKCLSLMWILMVINSCHLYFGKDFGKGVLLLFFFTKSRSCIFKCPVCSLYWPMISLLSFLKGTQFFQTVCTSR